MKILWLSPSDMLTEWCHGSLASWGGDHEIEMCWYDRLGVPPDIGMLNHADRFRPNVILYISQAGGPYCAEPSTFVRLRKIAPIVHICFDAADIGWRDMLVMYAEKRCFSLTVACDGEACGPVDLVMFHPVDPRPYTVQKPLLERPIMLGTCGGFPYGLRKDTMDALVKHCGLVIKPREETYGSYQRYADFLMSCQIIVDCALSGGGHDGKGPYARTLKTRAIEAGLAGSCLLELRSCALRNWAAEDLDYMTYDTPEEAILKVRELAENQFLRDAMARGLHTVALTKFSPAAFWGTLFDRLAANQS